MINYDYVSFTVHKVLGRSSIKYDKQLPCLRPTTQHYRVFLPLSICAVGLCRKLVFISHHQSISYLRKGALSSNLWVWFPTDTSCGLKVCPFLGSIPKTLVVELLNLIQQGFWNDSGNVVMPPLHLLLFKEKLHSARICLMFHLHSGHHPTSA